MSGFGLCVVGLRCGDVVFARDKIAPNFLNEDLAVLLWLFSFGSQSTPWLCQSL